MEGSVGTALRNARLQKKITIEEAARVTKIRPDRIKDLECDEYTRFPSLAYARSFLILYSKYLEIDVSRYQTMDVGNPAGVGDYQYLQNEGGVDSLRFTRPEATPSKPLLFRALMIVLACVVIGALSAYFVLVLNRLPSVDDLLKKHQKDDRKALSTPEPSASPVRVLRAIPVPPVTGGTGIPVLPAIPAPQTTGTTPEPTPTAASPSPLATGSAQPSPFLGGTSVLPSFPTPGVTGTDSSLFIPSLITGTAPETTGSADAQPTATPTPEPPTHEVRVRVTKKVWVSVVRDDPESDPVFTGRLSPGAAALVFKGHRFWIKTKESKDRQSLKVTKDGDPVAPGKSGVKIP